jgi:antitoxin component YwqK of YwqJK toxin-antitoxin module
MEVDIMEHRELLPVKSVIVFLVVLASCSLHDSSSNKKYNSATTPLTNVGGVYQFNGKPFSGTIYSLAENKTDTTAIGSFVHGLEDGEWKKYYPNNQLMDKRYYTNGKKTGLFEGWWSNGKKRLEYHFENGEYQGNCKDWSENGLLVSNMNYEKGYEDGLQQQFYETGKVKANYVMTDGRRYGLLGTKNCVNVSDSIFKR